MHIISTPSPNFDERPEGAKISWIILHYTSFDNAQTALDWLCDTSKKVSAHYLICRTGALYQLVADEKRAWHAGVSTWEKAENLNHTSLGIEMDNNGSEPYTTAQVDALLTLLEHLCVLYTIPKSNILGHSDIAPSRKIDPGQHFPWDMLYAHGFARARGGDNRNYSGDSKV